MPVETIPFLQAMERLEAGEHLRDQDHTTYKMREDAMYRRPRGGSWGLCVATYTWLRSRSWYSVVEADTLQQLLRNWEDPTAQDAPTRNKGAGYFQALAETREEVRRALEVCPTVLLTDELRAGLAREMRSSFVEEVWEVLLQHRLTPP